MSFYGKKFKKVKTENAVELIGKLNLSETTVAMLRNPDSLTTFTKNLDGTVQYQVSDSTGKVLLDQKIVLEDHIDFRAPDGMDTQVKFNLEGDVLKSHIHLPNGKVVHMDRHFEANSMKLGFRRVVNDPERSGVQHCRISLGMWIQNFIVNYNTYIPEK